MDADHTSTGRTAKKPRVRFADNGEAVVQAALFYLEAGAVALALAGATGSLVFAGSAEIAFWIGAEQGVLLLLVSAIAGVAAGLFAFLGYLRLLEYRYAATAVCVFGSLFWALPFALAAALALHHLPMLTKLILAWLVYVAVAGLVFLFKFRTLRVENRASRQS